MTPEQRAEQIDCIWQLHHRGNERCCIADSQNNIALVFAAALQPSAAVRELLRAADELRTIMHLDGTTKTPRYDKAAAVVRQELGL